MPAIDDFKRIAEVEFADIVKSTDRIDYKLRIALINNSFVDVHLSQRLPDKFGFHWECMDAAGTFYRYDNFPDKKWQSVSTYPYHLHAISQDAVEASPFPPNPVEGFRAFMEFIRRKIRK
jgi:hypothetical protein